MLWTKRNHHCTIFQTFECSNESLPNSSCHFWNYKVKVYSNFASLFSVMKDNSSVFFLAQTSYTLDKNSPSKWNFQTFEWLGENSPNSLCNVWNYKSGFLQTLHQSSVSWEITLLYFFSWNCIWIGQKEPIKVQNFRHLTAHVKFHQIFTLIGSFCWNYIKFQLKKYKRVISHDTEEWWKIWRKTDLLFQKW